MGWDGKYGKVTTEHGDIPDDEPVIVFRGRDKTVPDLLEHYLDLCEHAGAPDHHLKIIKETLDRFADWQREHPDRVVVPRSEGPAGRRHDQTLAEKVEQFGG